jgi:hypothetical protein
LSDVTGAGTVDDEAAAVGAVVVAVEPTTTVTALLLTTPSASVLGDGESPLVFVLTDFPPFPAVTDTGPCAWVALIVTIARCGCGGITTLSSPPRFGTLFSFREKIVTTAWVLSYLFNNKFHVFDVWYITQFSTFKPWKIFIFVK